MIVRNLIARNCRELIVIKDDYDIDEIWLTREECFQLIEDLKTALNACSVYIDKKEGAE